jgi:hypothetical protein
MRRIHGVFVVFGLLLLGACAGADEALQDVEGLASAIEGVAEAGLGTLSDAPSRGTDVPVRVVARVSLESTHAIEGTVLSTWEGGWVHRSEGRVTAQGRWRPTLDRVEEAAGSGTTHCYYASSLPDFTIRWEGPLSFPGVHHPLLHLTADGGDILVLYAAPFESSYVHPGAPACGPGSPVPAGELEAALFYMDLLDGERSPHAERSSVAAEQEGRVVARIPASTLAGGTSLRESVTFRGGDDEIAARLTVELELESGS